MRDYGKIMLKMNPVKVMRDRTGCGIILIHHSRKTPANSQDNAIDASLGSQALTGQADHILLLERHKEISEGRLITVETRIGYRSGFTIPIVYNDGNYTLMDEEVTSAVKQGKAEVEAVTRM